MYVNISYGRGFRGILEYSLDSKEEGQARQIGGNVMGDTEMIKEQFYAAAGRNLNVRKPVAHVIVAWHPDDQPDDATMAACGERLLDAIDAQGDDFQYIMVRHDDEPHPHMHLIVNRVGLEGQVLENKRKPYLRLREAATVLEREYDFTPAIPLADRLEGDRSAKGVPEPTPSPRAPAPFSVGRQDPAAEDAPPARAVSQVPAAEPAELAQIAQREPLGGRQPMHLKRMEERTGQRSAKHEVYRGVLAALQRSDGTWASLDAACREEGIAPSWSFTRDGTFNGASFTLLSPSCPGEAELDGEGRTFTFKGSQLGPHGGLSRAYLQRAQDAKLRSRVAQTRQEHRREERRLLQIARQLRAATVAQRHVVGPHLGRRLRWTRAYRHPLPGRSVRSILGLFDDKRLQRRQLTQIPQPLRRPRR